MGEPQKNNPIRVFDSTMLRFNSSADSLKIQWKFGRPKLESEASPVTGSRPSEHFLSIKEAICKESSGAVKYIRRDIVLKIS